MNILHIIGTMDPCSGGPSNGIRQLKLYDDYLNIHREVVCLDEPNSDWLNFSKDKVHALGKGLGNYGYQSKLVHWLDINVDRFDVVIINGIWQYHSYGAWRVLRKKNKPYFVFTHGMLDPWFKRNYPLKHLKKWLYWPWAEYRVLRDARAVIFTCEDERLLARESFWLYKVNEAVTAYGTATPPQDAASLSEAFLAAHPECAGKRLVLFLSRIQEKKGCDLLIDAFARLAKTEPRLHLVMAGPDQTGWVVELRERANALGVIDRISWPGMLQGDMKWGAFHAAEVFCLPSHQENFGIVVAESLACGKPVLISNKVNIWREIEADQAGFVDDDTLDGTVRNLERWFKLSPSEQAAMGQRAKACFAQRFHIQKAAERLVEIIRAKLV